MYIIGKTGMGKSELLKTLAIQDIQQGMGLAFVDPHGDPVEDLLDYIPEERIKDVVYLNPADSDFPIAFNVMENVDPDRRHLVADSVMGVFKKIWVDVWSPRMEYIMNYTILALLEIPDSTLLGINRMLSDKEYRRYVVDRVTDPVVKSFWTQEFAKYTERFAAEATPAIQNKVGQFISSNLVRNIIGQPKSTIDIRKLMDEGKILLINISKGRIGEDASRLLGGMIVTKIQLAAMSRVDIPEQERRDFLLIVDEFQSFATASFANILSEARKYHLSLIIAHQYVAQLDEEVRDAVFGNVGTIVAFRVGAEDAELLEKELAPEFMATDIVNLGKRQIYLKLMIDGVASRAFSAMTMDTPARPAASTRNRVIASSRSLYGRPRADVEKLIVEWHSPIEGGAEEEMPRRRTSMPRMGAGRGQGMGYRDERFAASRTQYMEPRDFGFRRDRGLTESEEPRQSVGFGPRRVTPAARSNLGAPLRQFPPQSDQRAPVARQPVARSSHQPLSLADAIKQGTVDFRGRKLEPKPPKPKVEADLDGLRAALKESLDK